MACLFRQAFFLNIPREKTRLREEITMADNNQVQAPLTAEAISEQNEIRLNKLRELTEAGKNPYEITRFDRTHLSHEILKAGSVPALIKDTSRFRCLLTYPVLTFLQWMCRNIFSDY